MAESGKEKMAGAGKDCAAKPKTTSTDDITSKLADASMLDLVVAMDCTGSMGSYIHSAQESVRNIVQSIVAAEKADVRFALVAYRDHPPQDSSFVTKVYDFTPSVSKMRQNLDSLSASGGGDAPEAVADALHCVTKLDYREEATKICILIADAPPHGIGCGGDGFPNGCPNELDPIVVCRSLAELGVTLYCVGCEPSISPYKDFFQGLAAITGGQYAPLTSAAVLSEVIVGGAREEMGLEKMMGDVEDELDLLNDVGEEEQVQQVYRAMKSKGKKGVQLKRCGAAMPAMNAQSTSIAAAESLASVRASWKPEPHAYGTKKKASFGGLFSRRRGGGGDGAPPMAPCMASSMAVEDALFSGADSYSVAVEDVSMEQCRRMVSKSKARSKKSGY